MLDIGGSPKVGEHGVDIFSKPGPHDNLSIASSLNKYSACKRAVKP